MKADFINFWDLKISHPFVNNQSEVKIRKASKKEILEEVKKRGGNVANTNEGMKVCDLYLMRTYIYENNGYSEAYIKVRKNDNKAIIIVKL